MRISSIKRIIILSPPQELLEELADMNADLMVVHRCLMDKANPNFTEVEHDFNTGAYASPHLYHK